MDQDQITNALGKKIVKVLLGVPKAGDTPPSAYDNRLEFQFRLGMLQVLSAIGQHEFDGSYFHFPEDTRFKFYTGVVGNVFTALARERMAEEAVKSGMDYLFMIDDDMMTPPDLFEKLYRHNVDVVAPLAFNRYPPHKPVLYSLKSGYDVMEHKEYYANYPIIDYPKNELVQCDAVGFGAVLIKTDVLKKIKKPWFMVTSGAGEDIHFCFQAGKSGFKVFMDTETKLGHLSDPAEITEETFESELNKSRLKMENQNAA